MNVDNSNKLEVVVVVLVLWHKCSCCRLMLKILFSRHKSIEKIDNKKILIVYYCTRKKYHNFYNSFLFFSIYYHLLLQFINFYLQTNSFCEVLLFSSQPTLFVNLFSFQGFRCIGNLNLWHRNRSLSYRLPVVVVILVVKSGIRHYISTAANVVSKVRTRHFF